MFAPATRKNCFARVALEGPSGGGKSLTGLLLAYQLAEGKPVAAIDTEQGSLSKYEGEEVDGVRFGDFCVRELTSYSPAAYTGAIRYAEQMGFGALLIDSLSHAWIGVDGALDQVSKKGGNSYTAWKDVTPQHDTMVHAILSSKMHVIVTMRQKTDTVLEPNERGKMVPRKVGLKSVQRDGMEYEFDLVVDFDKDNLATVSKSRCRLLPQGASMVKPNRLFFQPFVDWLKGAKAMPQLGPMQRQPENAVEYALNGPSTEWQKQRIVSLAQALGKTPDDIRNGPLRNRGVNRIADLTYAQADELYNKMEALHLKDVPF